MIKPGQVIPYPGGGLMVTRVNGDEVWMIVVGHNRGRIVPILRPLAEVESLLKTSQTASDS